MVSQIGSSAAASAALVSSTQSRGSGGMQALQEKLFAKLDVNGDGSVDETELGQFLNYANSATTGTAQTDSAQLFQSLDSNGDGSISKTELSDGAKTLFEQLRKQLSTSSSETTDKAAAPSEPPPGGRHGGGGLLASLNSLLDNYRSTATDAVSASASSTLSVAA